VLTAPLQSEQAPHRRQTAGAGTFDHIKKAMPGDVAIQKNPEKTLGRSGVQRAGPLDLRGGLLRFVLMLYQHARRRCREQSTFLPSNDATMAGDATCDVVKEDSTN
jgi:hypothetical protein